MLSQNLHLTGCPGAGLTTDIAWTIYGFIIYVGIFAVFFGNHFNIGHIFAVAFPAIFHLYYFSVDNDRHKLTSYKLFLYDVFIYLKYLHFATAHPTAII